MPLSVREVLLVLRAKDQASRVIADVGRSFLAVEDEAALAAKQQIHTGQALLGVGVAMAAMGAAGIAFYGNMAGAAMEYNRQAALTLTQVDQAGVSLEQIKDIARDVGSSIAAPFDQMQATLYDIFSSTNADLPQARMLLEAFSKSAVAGQVDIQDAARSTIAILNAFQLPLEKVNDIEDVMFQLVRKGVGTYEEFASTIGRAIPSAVRAGQTIETLSGMLAFLTRNGLSTAMASASAARALDAFSNPKVVERLDAMGVNTKDAAGNFRDIGSVITDLAKKMEGLTDPQRASFLQELFKGAGGTIQARRFIDIALQNPEGLNQFITDMNNAKGAAQDAYDVMLDQPATKMQLLKNNWEILKTEIGDVVIPIFLKLVDVGIKVIRWFRDMDPQTRRAIVYISLIAAAVLIFVGVLLSLVGVMLIFNGTLALMEISLAPVLIAVFAFILMLIALGLAFYQLYQDVAWFRDFVDDVWQGLQKIWQVFQDEGWEGVVKLFWDTLKRDFNAGLNAIWQDMQTGWDVILTDMKAGWGQWPTDFKTGLGVLADEAGSFLVDELWPKFANWATSIDWSDLGVDIATGIMKGLWWIVSNLWLLLAGIGGWIGDHVEELVQFGVDIAGHIVAGFWDTVKSIPVLGPALGAVETTLKGILSTGFGNPYDQGTQLTPDRQALLDSFVASTLPIGAGAAAGLGLGGYIDSTQFDIHDNVFQVADFDDLLAQMDATERLNAKAKGNAQPAPPAAPKPAAAAKKTLTPIKGKF